MAPKPAGKKRAASAAPKVEAKKPKPSDPLQALWSCVVKTIERAPEDQFPDAVKNMLGAMVPDALREVKDKRHEFQNRIVDMVASVMRGIEAAIVKRLEASKLEVTVIEAERAQRKQAAAGAAETAEATHVVLKAKEASVIDAASAVESAAAALDAAEVGRLKGLRDAELASENKSKLEAVFKEKYEPLKDGSCKVGAEAQLTALIKYLTGEKFELSLLNALPAALLKEVGKRGAFDAMVLQSLEDSFATRVAKFEELIRDAEPTRVVLDDVVTRAKAALEVAREAKIQRDTDLIAAQAADAEASEARTKMAKALSDLEPEIRAVSMAVIEADAELTGFREGPLLAFLQLKERSTPLPAPPLDATTTVRATAEHQELNVHEECVGKLVQEAP
eukprot:TRINITY_DN25089_c0_g1_i1.p1 TRINITY_DN25089_c0_g1~~TRINITY_DN25089_c0_g1_i1.p1  ORF type:complete len:392 (-),score=104.69 TRINITY_DN25089_c0_g1_i1:102-1277(-)